MDKLSKDSSYFSEQCQIPGKENSKTACLRNLYLGFEEAVAYLTVKFGESVSEWKWGKIHKTEYTHMPFSETSLKWFFHRTNENSPGSSDSINVAGWYQADFEKKQCDAQHTAGYRMTVDMSNKEGTYSLETGVSGMMNSQYYFNMNENHLNGTGYGMYFDSAPRI